MKWMLLAVGNRLSRDDGAGPAVAEWLQDSEWSVVDCGASLENVAGLVTRERPDVLVIVDAARMGLPPGSIRRLPIGGCERMLISTHGLPLSFVLDRLGMDIARIVLLGIEPGDLSLGEGLSPSVEAAAASLAEVLRCGELDRIPIHEDNAHPIKGAIRPA